MKRTLFLLIAAMLLLGWAPAQAQYYGESLGEPEQLAVANTFQYALENNKSGNPASWNNPDANRSGSTVPVRTFQLANGTYCREYQQLITIGGEQVQGYGTACRQPDGNWRIVAPDSLQEVAQVTKQEVHVYDRRPYRYYDPWAFGYPYPYTYFPGFISFSFGYSYFDRHYSRGHRHSPGYKSHYRRNNSHFGKSHFKRQNHGSVRHLGKHDQHFSGKRLHKARWGGKTKADNHRSIRFNKGGFKRFDKGGFRGRF